MLTIQRQIIFGVFMISVKNQIIVVIPDTTNWWLMTQLPQEITKYFYKWFFHDFGSSIEIHKDHFKVDSQSKMLTIFFLLLSSAEFDTVWLHSSCGHKDWTLHTWDRYADRCNQWHQYLGVEYCAVTWDGSKVEFKNILHPVEKVLPPEIVHQQNFIQQIFFNF